MRRVFVRQLQAESRARLDHAVAPPPPRSVPRAAARHRTRARSTDRRVACRARRGHTCCTCAVHVCCACVGSTAGVDLVWDGSGSRTPAVPWCGRHPRGGGSEVAPTGDASDRAAVLFCWASRAAHPAAEVEAEAELEIVRRSGEIVRSSGEIVRRSGEIGRRSGLGRHRRGEGETAVRAVPAGASDCALDA